MDLAKQAYKQKETQGLPAGEKRHSVKIIGSMVGRFGRLLCPPLWLLGCRKGIKPISGGCTLIPVRSFSSSPLQRPPACLQRI